MIENEYLNKNIQIRLNSSKCFRGKLIEIKSTHVTIECNGSSPTNVIINLAFVEYVIVYD